MPQLSLHTPIYDITVFEEDEAIVALEWGWAEEQHKTPLLTEAKNQLDSFFDSGIGTFNLPLNPIGTDFERKVWQAMQNIPSGETRSYNDIAKQVGSVARAVGRASGANPIPIIIPCHRVLGSSGKLTGYKGDGGTDTKRALLVLEGALQAELF